MKKKKFIITNFAYGIGPYLRTTELALAVNRELRKTGKETLGIIVPWVYGEKQKRIMLEEFPKQSKDIFLDVGLGGILKSVFYEKERFEDALVRWNETEENASKAARAHLSKPFEVEPLSGGEKVKILPDDIKMELARAPRVRYGITPVFNVAFGLQSEILRAAARAKEVKTSKQALLAAARVAERIEKCAARHFIAYPATMDFAERKYVYKNEVSVPPVTDMPKRHKGKKVAKGLYVTVTGIGGLERLFADASKLGLKLYSNPAGQQAAYGAGNPAVPGSIGVHPSILSSGSAVLHFARSGWGSAWLSLFTEVPIILPEYDGDDDPEILFNNKAIEKFGFGMVYRGESLTEILKKVPAMKTAARKTKKEIMKKFSAWDGNQFAARYIAKYI